MARVRLSLSVSDSHLKQIAKVAKAARKAGMTVEQQLDDIGVLTGSIDADKLERLREIEGVSQVEQERKVGVPPPESEIQ